MVHQRASCALLPGFKTVQVLFTSKLVLSRSRPREIKCTGEYVTKVDENGWMEAFPEGTIYLEHVNTCTQNVQSIIMIDWEKKVYLNH